MAEPRHQMPSFATLASVLADFRNEICQERTPAPQQRMLLFDHLVGGGEQQGREGKAECLGGLCVDDELEFGR
jgi:hypothetical protein